MNQKYINLINPPIYPNRNAIENVMQMIKDGGNSFQFIESVILYPGYKFSIPRKCDIIYGFKIHNVPLDTLVDILINSNPFRVTVAQFSQMSFSILSSAYSHIEIEILGCHKPVKFSWKNLCMRNQNDVPRPLNYMTQNHTIKSRDGFLELLTKSRL